MLTEKKVETQADRVIWTRALEMTIKGLQGFLSQYEPLLQNDRVGIHAKYMIDQAAGVNEDEFAPLHIIQKHEWYLRELHLKLRKRVEKLQKGEDPDATFGGVVLRTIQQMLSKSTT